MDVLVSGLSALEGPVLCQDGSLVVTSIDEGKVYRIIDGRATVLAVTGGGANGATEGADGRIYVSQNGGSRPARNEIRSPAGVQVIDSSGAVQLFGQVMQSPNDLCFGPDGKLYVTDPTRKPESDGRIWRCDVDTMKCELLVAVDWYPNGIGFSADDDFVYLADSRNKRLVRLPLSDPRPEMVEIVATLDHGIPDGFAFDVAGNLLVACISLTEREGDIQVFRDGKLQEIIRPGNSKLYTNLALSQAGQIFLCDADSGTVLTAQWRHGGLALHPFRN